MWLRVFDHFIRPYNMIENEIAEKTKVHVIHPYAWKQDL
jgi:hypothetical protein